MKPPGTTPDGESGSVEAFVFPASFAQRSLWFLQQYAPESPVYNVPIAHRLRGPLDVQALQESLHRVMARHEPLRSTFALQDGELQQIVAAESRWPLVFEEAPGASLQEREAVGRARLIAESRRPFDLGEAPPVRALLLQLGEEDHLLLVVLHHIISDEWSAGILHRELQHCYDTLLAGREPDLPELPVQYADFSAWQRESLQGPALARLEAYWRGKLAGAPAGLELPLDHPRPREETFRGSARLLTLDPALTRAVGALAHREEVTTFMFLLAVFCALLQRHCGQEDLVVGSPMTGRSQPETEGLIGYFINTLALRADLSGNPTFREFLQRVRRMALEAYAHAGLPFERLLDLLQVKREANRSPVFQAMFVLQDATGLPLRLAGIQATPEPLDIGVSHFELTLFALASAEGMELRLEYNSDLFEAETIQRMLHRFETLLRHAVAAPDGRLAGLELLPEAEQRELAAWNQTGEKPPGQDTVHRWFEEQTACTPEAVAVEYEDEALSYRELDRRASQLAHHLRSLGAGPDVPVGLCLDRSSLLAVGVLGILKSGSGYVPLDPANPPERFKFLLADSKCPLLVTRGLLAGTQPEHSATVVDLEALPEGLPADPLPMPSQPDHLAYVMYTSGSTGRPKGVAMEHHPLVNLLAWQLRQSAPARRTLQFASASFDVSFQEFFSTWLAGGTLVIAPQETRLDPDRLWQLILRRKLERLFLPVVMLDHLAQTAERCGTLAADLREVITAGEPLRITPAIRSFFQRHAGATLCNQYGPTETHVVTAYQMPADVDSWPDLPAIGRPIANVQIHLLDAHRNPVPPGVPGDLHVAGAALARGYWGRPDLTAERFLSEPAGGLGSRRLYRTGDLARYLPDGNLEFLGRRDTQIKIRGFRVELEEIEAVLLNCPGIKEAAVAAHDAAGERALTGYVVVATPADWTPEAWQKHLKKHLPDYMVPGTFVELKQLPLSPNQKLDRTALPPPQWPAVGLGLAGNAQPMNLLELELLRIWRRLFGREDVARQDNFFALGGHSLLAARLAVEAERLLGRRLPVASLFQAPTVEALARMLQDQDWLPAWTSLVPLQPLGSNPPIFFVHGWGGDVFCFLDLARAMAPDQPVYGLQAIGLDGRRVRHGSVADMAAHYVREMRSLQPHGPYSLGGYSMGGWLAWEIARQLRQQGEAIAMLALLDTGATCKLPWPLHLRLLFPHLLGRTFAHSRRVAGLPFSHWLGYLNGRLAALKFHLRTPGHGAPATSRSKASPSSTGQVGTADYFHQLVLDYQPAPFLCAVDLFQCEGAGLHSLTLLRRLALGGVRPHRVPGDHFTMIDAAHVTGFASVFLKALREARLAAPAPPAA